LESVVYIGGGGGGGSGGGATKRADISDFFAAPFWASIPDTPPTYPPSTHAHAESEVTGLVDDLADKSDVGHGHAESDVTGLVTDLGNKSNVGHAHSESDVTSLVADLAGKAPTDHDHVKADITDFAHTHTESEVTNLVTDLGNKSNVGHGHAESDVANLVTDLGNKSNVGHVHAEGDVTNLTTDLAGKVGGPASAVDSRLAAFDGTTGKLVKDSGKAVGDFAAASHAHSESDVTGLVTDLGNKSNVGHGHTESEVTNLVSDLAGKEPSLPSKTGNANKYLQVKSDETGFQYGTPTAALPDMVMTKRSATVDTTVTAGYSAYVVGDFEIAADAVLELEADSVLEIG
jgi:hypothetical protein